MFSDEILEKIFSHKETSKIPIGCQSTMIHVIEEVLEGVENVNEFQQYVNTDSRNITETGNMNNVSNQNMRDYREGRSGMSRRGYMESKEQHKSNSQEDKQKKMLELEKYVDDLSNDVKEMIMDSTPEEKSMLKQKLMGMANNL